VLTEPQIQRYARQLLLRDVGEKGQEALGAVQVELALGGGVADAAAAYLRAGGTEVGEAKPAARPPPDPVRAPGTSGGPWALTPALLGSAPRAALQLVAAPRAPEPGGVVVGSGAGGSILWSVAPEGCRGCLRQLTQDLGPPELPDGASVQLGSLLALLVQRRALGLASPLEGLAVSPTGVLSTLAAPPCAHRPPCVPASVLGELVRHLAASLPDEGCAVLLARQEQVRLVPMENAQARHHVRDPEAFPRTAGTAFSFEPRAWLALLREADRTGERILAVAHSHPEGGPGFSAEDRRWAAPDGQPLLPGVAHLVIAFRAGRPWNARWAVWRDGDFLESDCPLPGT
jgi:[CysO sulfur-carrier protein]-S-L-cysteine hydrolase